MNVNTKFLHNHQIGSVTVDDYKDQVAVSLPNVEAKIYRSSFGDDPQKKNWLVSDKEADIITKFLETSYDISVLKKYKYNTKCNVHEDCAAEGCPGYVEETGYASSNRSGSAPIEINTYVYNGKKDLSKKVFENKISNNYDADFKARILWTNTPIKFNVIRYMWNLNERGEPITWQSVPGKYERGVVQQCSADIDWNVTSSMKQDYEKAKNAAREGKQDKTFYDKAVFATDKNLQRNYEYPIKSGYYFNPTGTYTFEVTTVTYKNSKGETEEHKKLVNELINSFRYESNLIYINSNNQPVNIANGPYTDLGVLTVKDNELITEYRQYEKKEYRIPYYSDKPYDDENENKTHDFWKMSMEGYSLSGSLDSYNKYKYREYVAGGEVYEITETTKVTIVVNKDNKMFYTHPKMPDGEYYVRVKLSPINLSKITNVEYKSINDSLKEVILDGIKVTVKGSIYDDIS
ncbi:MAG TPA: hypothetical protein PLH43_10330 [Acetivibrio sp.]|uniref:hypothetical protein n=1 Tax=Acetivibrio sp. TaxID=1872092 RepID=UPI002CCC49FB|nr:hypothetical protein [Acetivibrio sp.]HOM03211.1 hypothetical protein [Acetivibrio sp.]